MWYGSLGGGVVLVVHAGVLCMLGWLLDCRDGCRYLWLLWVM